MLYPSPLCTSRPRCPRNLDLQNRPSPLPLGNRVRRPSVVPPHRFHPPEHCLPPAFPRCRPPIHWETKGQPRLHRLQKGTETQYLRLLPLPLERPLPRRTAVCNRARWPRVRSTPLSCPPPPIQPSEPPQSLGRLGPFQQPGLSLPAHRHLKGPLLRFCRLLRMRQVRVRSRTMPRPKKMKQRHSAWLGSARRRAGWSAP